MFLLQLEVVKFKLLRSHFDELVSCFRLAASKMTLVLANFPRECSNYTLLREYRIFLVVNALLNSLLVTADLKLVVLTPLCLPFAKSVKILQFEKLRLDSVELKIQVL